MHDPDAAEIVHLELPGAEDTTTLLAAAPEAALATVTTALAEPATAFGAGGDKGFWRKLMFSPPAIK